MQFKNRELTTRPLFPVGINVFVIRDDKLLLGKRKSAYHDGEWGLPGGHLEEGESMFACAHRELEEETSIIASGFNCVITDNDTRQDKFHYVHFGFIALDPQGDAKLMEPDHCYEWQWFPLDQLPSPLFIGHKKSIEGYRAGKTFID